MSTRTGRRIKVGLSSLEQYLKEPSDSIEFCMNTNGNRGRLVFYRRPESPHHFTWDFYLNGEPLPSRRATMARPWFMTAFNDAYFELREAGVL